MGKQGKTPRYYVDMVSFLQATGDLDWDDTIRGGAELLYMNPSNPFTRIDAAYILFKLGDTSGEAATTKTSFPINFCALLNHNLGSASGQIHIGAFKGIGGVDDGSYFRLHADSESHAPNWTNVINCGGGGSYSTGLGAELNGTSIWTFDAVDDYWYNFYIMSMNGDNYEIPDADLELNHQLGSFIVGKYWDASNNPDLSLTMSRRFDGIKRQKTIGGKTLPNIYYDGATEWTMNGLETYYEQGLGLDERNIKYKYPPFELDLPRGYSEDEFTQDFNQRAKSGLGRKGLRSWKLTFSYISDGDMWMDNEVSSKLINDDVIDDGSGNADPNPMLSDDSFNFVLNCTLGGTLPFIFQPDNANNNTDQFSICVFRANTLNIKQVAHNTYSVSVTIDEVG